ncbi:MAG: hypothetical protein MZU97_18435 [Bacillus subtilis]|nr:hypothetical protein [Bacillus subtilis]
MKAFLAEIRFDRLGAFAYSKETDTPAYDFPDQIAEDIKAKRLNDLLSLQQKIAKQKNKEHIGTVQKTLIEHYDSQSKFYYGRSYAFAPDDVDGYIVFQAQKRLSIGAIAFVKIKANIQSDWIGDAVL